MSFFLILRNHFLILISPDERTKVDVRKYLQEEEMILDFSHFAAAFSDLQLPRESRIEVLVDFPWTHFRIVDLPPFRKNKIRQILVHELGNQFSEEIEDINFDFYQNPLPEKKQHTVIYSCHRKIGEDLHNQITDEGSSLSGLTAFPHLVEQEFLENLQTDETVIYFSCSPEMITVFKYENRLLQDCEFFPISEKDTPESLKKRISLKLKISDFLSEDIQWNYEPECEEFILYLQNDEVARPKELNFDGQYSFFRIASALKATKKKSPIKLIRYGNAFFKNLYYSKGYIRQIIIMVAISLAVFLGVNLYIIQKNNARYEQLQTTYTSLIKRYLPNHKNLSTAPRTLGDRLDQLKKSREERRPFMTREYTMSEFLLNLSKLKSIAPEINLNSADYQEDQITLKGICDNQESLEKVKNFLGAVLNYEVKASSRIVRNELNFEILMTRI